MEVSKMSIYRHPVPGYTLPLWLNEKPITQKKNGKANAVFSDTGKGIDRCGLFRTDEDDVKKAIEQSKAFKNGAIVKLKSAEDIKLETKKREQAKHRENVISMAKSGLFNMDSLKEKKADELREFADGIGVETETDKGKRTKHELLTEIESILYPKEDSE